MKILALKVNEIEQNENSRVIYKTADLAEIMRSMQKDGLLQPIGVKEFKPGKYEAVFGNRRLQAAKKLGWPTIMATVLEADTDNDRDILGLIENIKRVNTTLAEDGRMFLVLRDRGLTDQEIAARLDISTERVGTAIEVHQTVPAEFRPIIVNRVSGAKKRGTISATAAHAIMNVRRTHKLNRKQTRQLLEYARTEGVSTQHIGSIAPLMKGGLSVEDAVKTAQNVQRIALFFFMDAGCVKKLEKKYNTNINDLLLTQLEKNPEFKIQRQVGSNYRHKPHSRPGAA